VHGIPRNPEDLRDHTCIAYRSSRGIVLDEWKYRRNGVIKNIAIQPRLISDDQDATNEAAVGGLGIVRSPDLMIWPWLERGLLVPVLQDWEALEGVPIRLLYRRNMRSSARVRAFAAFVAETFLRLKKVRSPGGDAEPAPQPIPSWYHKKWVGALARRALKHQPSA
jgi:DNA-binding transcriptional LysR family regulator